MKEGKGKGEGRERVLVYQLKRAENLVDFSTRTVPPFKGRDTLGPHPEEDYLMSIDFSMLGRFDYK